MLAQVLGVETVTGLEQSTCHTGQKGTAQNVPSAGASKAQVNAVPAVATFLAPFARTYSPNLKVASAESIEGVPGS